MDAFELLLRASDSNLNLDTDTKDFKPKFHMMPSFDYRDHMESTMLDPVDSIMMLADQACQKSPIKKRTGGAPDSPDFRTAVTTAINNNEFGNDNSAMGTLLQYGSYFNMGTTNGGTNRRSRAMSEPWIRQENWSEELQFNRTMGTSTSGNSGNPGQTNAGSSDQPFAPFNFGLNRDFGANRGGLFIAEQEMGHRLGYSTLETSLPQMLDQYSSIYNKNGRIGIYTREERSAIIHRFREKRKRRVWKKKIRYFCRKNLADRRVRVKGRFVKSAVKVQGSSNSSTTSGSADSPTNTNTSTTSGATTPHKTGRGTRAGSGGTELTEASDLTADDLRRSALSNTTNAYSRQYATTHRSAGRGAPNAGIVGVGAPSAQQVATSRRGAGARQALTGPGSDEEDEVDEEEDEEDEDNDEEDPDGSTMEVVLSGSADPSSAEGANAHKPRRFKLVLTSSDASGDNNSSSDSNHAASTNNNNHLVLRTGLKASSPIASASKKHLAESTAVKNEDLQGVDLLAALAAKSLGNPDESDDYDEQEEEDVFTSEMMRLPTHKRIRRHSIAY